MKKKKELKIYKIPNKLHFETQLFTRMQIVESKKKYKRARDKKINAFDAC